MSGHFDWNSNRLWLRAKQTCYATFRFIYHFFSRLEWNSINYASNHVFEGNFNKEWNALKGLFLKSVQEMKCCAIKVL